MSNRLSSFPQVVVEIACEGCGRRGRYRLARLAYRFGPEAEMVAVLEAIVGRCQHRTPSRNGCGARIVEPSGKVKAWGGATGPVALRNRRNPRRAYDHDGREFEPARIRDILPPRGNGEVHVRCSLANGCGHSATLDARGWPPDLYVPDIGLRLRCSRCGRRGTAWTVGSAVDPGP